MNLKLNYCDVHVLFLWDFCLIDAAIRVKGYLSTDRWQHDVLLVFLEALESLLIS